MAFRAIPIASCLQCPHKVDWSSSGLYCTHNAVDRLITREPSREPAKVVPNWCPLPKVVYSEE